MFFLPLILQEVVQRTTLIPLMSLECYDSKASGGGVDTSPPLYIIVQGAFLNFHEDFPIIGVNVLENFIIFLLTIEISLEK